jgi:hypothetical protein
MERTYTCTARSLAPITLINSRIDNPEAAHAFVQEIARRKEEASAASGPLTLLDYWMTWFAAILALIALFSSWHRQSRS